MDKIKLRLVTVTVSDRHTFQESQRPKLIFQCCGLCFFFFFNFRPKKEKKFNSRERKREREERERECV